MSEPDPPTATTWTANLGNAPVPRKVAGLNELVRMGARRIGLQEAGGKDGRAVVRAFLRANPTWRAWRPLLVPGAKAVTMLYDRHHVKPLRLRSIMAVLSRYVGPGPGPDRAKAKPILLLAHRVRIASAHRTGRRVWSREHIRWFNTHFISGVMSDHSAHSLRDRHHHDHAQVLARLIGTGDRMARSLVTMDGNADPDYPGWAPVKATGIDGWDEHDQPTHGEHHRYDYVLGPDGERLYVRGYSDHALVGAGQ